MMSGSCATSSSADSHGGIAAAPANVDLDVAALLPAEFLQALRKRRDARLSFGIVFGGIHQYADASHPLGLLRVRREQVQIAQPAYSRAVSQIVTLGAHNFINDHRGGTYV